MANGLLVGQHNNLNFNLMHLDEWLSQINKVELDLNDYVKFLDLSINHFDNIYLEKSLNLLKILVEYPDFFGDSNRKICMFSDLCHYLTLDNIVLFAKNNIDANSLWASPSCKPLSFHQQKLLSYFSSLAGFQIYEIFNGEVDIPIETYQMHQLIINPIIFYAYGYCYSIRLYAASLATI